MEAKFRQLGTEHHYWESGRRILLAVSSGVDSMVLLHMMAQISQQNDFQIAVAHVNHQIREISATEETFLKKYCAEREIPFFVRRWESLPVSGIEEAARRFRYQFFQELMHDHYFDTLMTAHHADDQLETMLMKMIRDGNLKSASGIKEIQSFAGGKLIRPLLHFSKEEILTYAEQHGVEFYEDETNFLMDVQRNRIRHQIVPLLKKENNQILQHFQKLSQQLIWADDILQQGQKNWFKESVQLLDNNWRFELDSLAGFSEAEKYFVLQYFFLQAREQLMVGANDEQLQKIMQLLKEGKAQWALDFENGWQVLKEYGQFSLQNNVSQQLLKAVEIQLGEGLFLSEKEWLGLLPLEEKENVPEKVKLWSEISQPLALDFPSKVVVRKRKSGDRIQLTPALRKKVSRVLIDKKIPNEKRERMWLVEDAKNNILAVLPVAFSYLSIAKETDKIHYILLYKYQE